MIRATLAGLFLVAASCASGTADTPESRAESWLGATLDDVAAIYGAPDYTRRGWDVYRFETHVPNAKGGAAQLHWCELSLRSENGRVADQDIAGFGRACDEFVIGRR